MMEDCIFCKIMNNEIPCSKVYEDSNVIAFLDIAPMKKGHTLIVTKEHHETLLDLPDELTDALFVSVKKVAPAVMKAVGAQGFNIEVNNYKAAGQLVPHVHIHIIPRHDDDNLKHWPQGSYEEGEIDTVKEKIAGLVK